MTHSQLRLVLVLGVPLLALPACAPKRHVTVEEISKLGKLSEVMDAQATYADPMFKKRDQAAFTDAEYAELTDASARLQATSLKIKDFSKGAGFDELATRLHDRTAELGTAAQGKDGAGVRKALTEMKATCKECHSKFR